MAGNLDVTGHLDPTLEVAIEKVKKRAFKGVVTLTGRTFVLNIIALVAQGFLWAFLTEYEFGVFWIVSAIVNFLVYFSDVGLAAALIQKREKVTDDDLKTTFTIQQILVVSLIFILVLISPVFERTHSLSYDGKMLLYALGISFFLSSLKTIPSVLLERELEFGKFVIPQVVENLVYNISVVYFAWSGLGIKSFTYSVILRSVVGLVAVYLLRPWRPRFAISKDSFRKLLSFGLPYQLNSLLAVIKDDGMTILMGKMLGPAGVGILGTAQKLSQYPLRFFMDNVTKVSFPAFSRMQSDKNSLKVSVEKSIFFISFLVFPSVIGLIIVSPLIIDVIVKYERWRPALFPLSILAINTIFAAVTTQLTNLLNAIGKIKIHFKLMIMWTALTVIFVPLFASYYGVSGAAAGYALVGTSSVVAIYIAKKHVDFSIWESALKPLLAAAMMGVLLMAFRGYLRPSVFSLMALVIFGATFYLTLSFIFKGGALLQDVQKTFKSIFSR